MVSGHWGGMDNTGQLGRDGVKHVPSPIQNPAHFVKVSAGRTHVLALDTSGNVYSWGGNDLGQLGRAGTDDAGFVCHGGPGCRSSVPTDIEFSEFAIDIVAGRYSSIVLTSSGRSKKGFFKTLL